MVISAQRPGNLGFQRFEIQRRGHAGRLVEHMRRVFRRFPQERGFPDPPPPVNHEQGRSVGSELLAEA